MTKEELQKRISGSNTKAGYVTWSDAASLNKAMVEYSKSADEFDIIHRNSNESSAAYTNYGNLDPYSSARPGLARHHYSSFRPDEALPRTMKEVFENADKTYREVGIVRNIIDLMSDFACQGIRLSHKDKRIEKFYKNWFEKVSGKERSERFSNYLFRLANVVMTRQTMEINLKQRAKLFKTSAAEEDEVAVGKNVIPIQYTFIHPSNIKPVGGELAAFTKKKLYQIELPAKLRTIVQNPDDDTKKIIAKLPPDILKAAKTNKPYTLPEGSTLVFHYKKDDWDTWAYPMVNAIARDIILLDKLKLADIAALDGAISNLRIIKVGSLEHNLAPSPGMIARLKEILKKHVGVGTIDLIWGPDIEIEESKTQVHQFLGEGKYVPTLNNIFGGLGIPQTLTGFGGGGTTNNFVGLKTLIQRLQYARDVLISFWTKEIEMVREAMSFAEAAEIEFDYPDLGDSDSEKALLIQLADRNLISSELLRQRFGHNNNLEESRISKEYQAIQEETAPPKYGPFINGEPEDDLAKIALQQNMLTPEQLGLEPKFGNSKPPIQAQKPGNLSKPKGQPQQGRPKGKKDSTKRTKKTFRPKTKASIEIWAKDAQKKISDLLYNDILQTFGKKNVRELTVEEHNAAEATKFNILMQLEPFSKIDKNTIAEAFFDVENNSEFSAEAFNKYSDEVKLVSTDLERVLSMVEIRDIQVKIYSEIIGDSYED